MGNYLSPDYMDTETSERLAKEVTDQIASQVEEGMLLQRAVDRFTLQKEILKAIEELSELTTELSRWLQDDGRTNEDKIAEETADVEIVCKYAEMVAGPEKVAKWKEFKLNRLIERLKNEKV